jgi:glycosyltransferase involved in cell wall biosynthesis
MQAMVGLLARGLAAANVDVHIAAGGLGAMPATVDDAVAHGAATLHRLPAPHGLGLARWLRALRGLIGDLHPDVVHGHGLRTAWPLALVARRATTLVTCHGLPPDDLERSARLVRRARVPVAAVGPGLVADLAAVGLPAVLLENGVTSAPTPAARSWMAAELGIPAATPLVVQAARLSPQKDPLVTVAAVAALAHAHLLLIGGGPLEERVRDEAARLGMAERLHVFGWRADARELLGAADVVTLSSRWEGQPLVLVEAAAAGVPIVATSCPGIGDWLIDGEQALLSPVGDVAYLAQNLATVIDDASTRDRLVTNGHALAAQHSVDAMVAAHLACYADLSSVRHRRT